MILRRRQTRYPGGDGGKVARKVRWNGLIEHGRGVSGSVFSRHLGHLVDLQLPLNVTLRKPKTDLHIFSVNTIHFNLGRNEYSGLSRDIKLQIKSAEAKLPIS